MQSGQEQEGINVDKSKDASQRIKWEYKVVPIVALPDERTASSLNIEGDEYWELVTVVGQSWVFKRPRI